MTEFLQLHVITCYPPANLNRDDLGRPKTAVFGGKNRLRISSQSLKRAWRQSSVFESAVGGNKGVRTREIGKQWVFEPLLPILGEKRAAEAAKKISEAFGKADEEKPGLIKQLAHVGPEEQAAIAQLVEVLAAEKRIPTDDEVKLLRERPRAADIALFGRMLAAEAGFNVEAAAQVAHAITVHEISIQDDFFTAVDDLNRRADDEGMGAGHVGETEFAAGVFYLYICVDRDRLLHNLKDDEALAGKALRGLVEAVLTVAPVGKQNSFGSRAVASYALAERGDRQPRALSVAFLGGLQEGDYVGAAIEALESQVEKFDQVYGKMARARRAFNVPKGAGSMAEILDFVATPGEVLE